MIEIYFNESTSQQYIHNGRWSIKPIVLRQCNQTESNQIRNIVLDENKRTIIFPGSKTTHQNKTKIWVVDCI